MVFAPKLSSLAFPVYFKPGQQQEDSWRMRAQAMGFGNRLRAMRTAKGLSQRALGERVGVSFTYISKVENGKLDFGDYPSEDLICRLAATLDSDEEERLLLAEKIPQAIRRRFFERPDAFGMIARLDDKRLDGVLAFIEGR
jgi:transcriptional regulator with XRE-family HTH domain